MNRKSAMQRYKKLHHLGAKKLKRWYTDRITFKFQNYNLGENNCSSTILLQLEYSYILKQSH